MKHIVIALVATLALAWFGLNAHATWYQLSATSTGANFVLTDNTQTSITNGGAVQTWTGVNFGTGASDIPIIVTASNQNSATNGYVAIKVNSVSCTVVTSSNQEALVYCPKAALTTATVEIDYVTTGGFTAADTIIAAGKVTTTSASAPTTANSGGHNTLSSFNPQVNIPTSGVGVLLLGDVFFNGSNGTWTGSSNDPNGDYFGNNAGGNGAALYTAHTLTPGSPGGATIAFGGNRFAAWVAASWGP